MPRGCLSSIAALAICQTWLPASYSAEKATNELRGLILLKSEDAILKEGNPGLAMTGLQVGDIAALKGKDFEATIHPFFGKPIDETLLKGIGSAIQNYYRSKGFPLVDPVFPPQTVSQGVLQMVVVESKLGKVIFEGTNKWTQTGYIRKSLHIQEGGPVDENKVMADINWLNRNRFRNVDAFYKPGEGKFESDLVVRTSERFPLGGSFGIDNTGNKLTGENRLTAGVDWGKAFGFNDNLLSYRYITDTDFEFLRVHSASYTVFLPWRHALTLSGSYADVKGNIPNLPVTQKGSSYQANLRYSIPLPNLHSYRHEFMLGTDYRHLDNNLEYNFVNLFADTTEIAQGMLGYTGLLPDNWGSTVLGIEYYYSPGNLAARNTDAAFGNSYPFAQSDYSYAKFNLERNTKLIGGFTWRLSGTYQLADGNLVPSEQFALGGAYTIRGYEERVASGAEGFIISNELRAPSFSPGRWLDKTAKDELQVLGFFDYGETSNRELLKNEDPHVLLKSAGVGLRYQVSRFVSVRFDYGWQLEDSVPGFGHGRSRGHVTASFTF